MARWKIILSLNLMVLLALTFSACTMQTKQRKPALIPEQRQAPPQVQLNFQALPNNQLSIDKNVFNRIYKLIPSIQMQGRTPDFQLLKPTVVSFARFSNNIGLYEVTKNDLYTAGNHGRFLQSFQIVSETPNRVIVDMAHGISGFEIASPIDGWDLKKIRESVNKKNSDSSTPLLQVKDSIIENISVGVDRITLNQSMRIIQAAIVNKENENKPGQNQPNLEYREIPALVQIEIQPYVENRSYVSKTFDKTLKNGFFLNLAFVLGQSDPDPQITTWDLTQPITVQLTSNTPEEMIPSIETAIEYWNIVLGKKIFNIERGAPLGAVPMDRHIVVRWVPWDDAGFAVAGFQADPLTGEITRGQVFMTSSWAKALASSGKRTNLLGLQQSVKALEFEFGACRLEQSDIANHEEGIQSQIPTDSVRKQATNNVITSVIAHELGHVLGLRHNFAGSSSHPGTDEELESAQANYLAKGTVTPGVGVPSTTVMDYLNMLNTAILGAQISAGQILPYDHKVTQWGYFSNEESFPDQSYCTDEFIQAAQLRHNKIIGCDAFDSFKNPVGGIVADFNRKAKSIAVMNLDSTYRQWKNSRRPLNGPPIMISEGMNLDLTSASSFTAMYYLEPYFYKLDDYYSPLVPIQSVADKFFTPDFVSPAQDDSKPKTNPPFLYSWGKDWSDLTVLMNQIETMGGYSGILLQLLKPTLENPNYFSEQIASLDEAAIRNDYPEWTDEDFRAARTAQKNAAKSADLYLGMQVVLGLAPQVATSLMSQSIFGATVGVGESIKPVRISALTPLGNLAELYKAVTEIHSRASRNAANPIALVSGNKTLILNPYKTYVESAGFFKFVKDQIFTTPGAISNQDIFPRSLVANIISILELKGPTFVYSPAILTRQNLEAELKKLDWTHISGATATDQIFTNELDALEAFQKQAL